MSTNKPKIIDVNPAAEAETTKNAVDAETTKNFETTVTNLKAGVEKATAGFEATQVKMKEGVEKAMKTAEELVAFNQGNIEAQLARSDPHAPYLV